MSKPSPFPLLVAAVTLTAGLLIVSQPSAAYGAAEPESAACTIEAFGRVVTSDPKRMEGTRAKRAEEFPAEDIVLSRELLPAEDGSFTVPTWPEEASPKPDAVGCIGLEWDEQRLLCEVALEFADPAAVTSGDRIELQYWAGESAWQGSWQLPGVKAEQANGRLRWRFGAHGQLTQKVRWILPASPKPLVVKSLTVQTDSVWKTAEIHLQWAGQAGAEPIPIEVYNGFLVDPPEGALATRCMLHPAQPLRLRVRYAAGGKWVTDRTVLRFRSGEHPFGVAVEDVLANDCVYLPHADVFITRDPAPVTLDEYRQRIAAGQTVLQRVRGMPDQTFAQAMEKVHNPVQDRGPMMISLACDNRKFIVHEDGSVTFRLYDRPDARYEGTAASPGVDAARLHRCRFCPRFGDGNHQQTTRHLDGGWLPMPVTTMEQGGLVYRQRTYVAPADDAPPSGGPSWLRRRAVCVAEIEIANPGSQAVPVALGIELLQNAEARQAAEIEPAEGRVVAKAGPRVLALLDLREASPLEMTLQAGQLSLTGSLPAGAQARCTAFLPAWDADAKQVGLFLEERQWAKKCQDYWQGIMAPAMQVELPDDLLSNIIRASQIHCMLAARNEEAGARVVPWIASDCYEEAIDSEGHAVVRGMDMIGHQDFARRSLDFFIHRYAPQGYLTTGYVLVGTGEDLWTWAEHCGRSGDLQWLRATAPKIIAACRWIIKQRRKTMQRDARGRKLPQYGLAPPGVSADWNRFAYRFFNDAQYCAGLREAGRALSDVDPPAAAAILEEAQQYRRDLLRAYHWCQGCSPALPLADGTWVPAYPSILDCFGNPGSFYPGEDGQRSWCYCVECGAHHLAATGVLDPCSQEVTEMVNHMEDVEFLRSGQGDYPEERNRQDFFSLGGFSKLQPYYTRIAEIYAQRDDVKPFLRSYFNAIPSLLSRETLSFCEHFHNLGAWNKTHETGWFLCQTRTMLVMERGDDLWLAPFVTNQWTKDGMKIAVRNSPTRFGPTSYTITSAADSGRIEAVIEPPNRKPPRRIVIRLRHPQGKPIRSVTVDGKPHNEFDARRECISLAPSASAITVVAEY